MTVPNSDTGIDTPPTAPVADLASDTINPVGESAAEPHVEAGSIEVDVKTLERQLAEQRRIQSGLDRANSSLKGQVEASQERIQTLQTRLETYNTADGANNDVITDYMAQLEALAADRDQWQTQAQAAILSEGRVRIVASEFPGLMPLIDANALPQATDDEGFRASMTALQDTLGSAAEARFADQVHGAKPPAAPPANAPSDINAIKRLMLKAEPGSEEFNRLRDQWYAVQGIAI